ncbi:non-ribosomal peptide synthetase/type I polyketide synthase, partial [Archangium sp.]|uniref:non-ribosomal peptide synthetase/type I polyketide synthase n=1 Tax=Archangium sp. TaxID=1872627 RepID=UPI002D6D7B2E
MPRRGIGYGLLKYLREEGAGGRLRTQPAAQVSFNYLGQLDGSASDESLFRMTGGTCGPEQSEQGPRSHVLEVSGQVLGGRLELTWVYSENLHERATIEALADGYLEALKELIAGRTSAEAVRYAPSDFPLARLEQVVLERVLRQHPRVEDIYPLSPLQQGMLFHALLSPGSDVYFTQLRWTFKAPLDVAAFRKAWREVVARNAILRTSFFWEGLAEPVQVVHPEVELPWSELDWRGLPPVEQQARVESLMREDRARTFELSRAPLMRVNLMRLGEQEYRFVWSFHHLLLDGWSLGLLLEELFAFYDAFTEGKVLALERGTPFRDYIAWLQRQDSTRMEAWWRQVLGGFTASTPLPGARVSAIAAAGNDERELRLPASLTEALESFARQHQVTLNTLVLAAWSLVLGRYSGEQDVVFGTTVAGRPPELSGVETVMGMLINSIPMRVQMPPAERLGPWLQKLQAQQLELRQYEHSPLAQVQGWSDVPRGTPLFESLFVFENYPVDASIQTRAGRLANQDIRSTERINYPLGVLVTPGHQLLLHAVYEPSRFEASVINRVLEHWKVALEGLLAGPEQRLSEISLLSEEERHRLLVEWNSERAEYPADRTVHQLFEEQVRRMPGAVAVEYGGRRLTYEELNRRANQLAHHLRGMGVGPEVRVGLCVERSLELVVSLLGILKAGGVYVPLDASYPRERLEWMKREAGLAALVAQEKLVEAVGLGEGMPVVRVDTQWEALMAHQPEGNPKPVCSGENLAYVMFTSGSTGKPKGVGVPHRAVSRLVLGANYAHFGPQEVWLQLAPISFDASTLEVWGALLHGAKLVVYPAGILSMKELGQALVESGVTSLWLTAALFDQMQAQQPEALGKVRQVLAGGDVLPVGRVRERLASGGVLINGYGPTENTTFSTCYRMETVEQVGATVSIGRPIANTTVYVLDEQMQPVPVGVPGELYVGGEGLAVGYVGRPELTAEKFVPHPFSGKPGERLYRTGDVVRYLPGGELEFIGRRDAQVKIRGFRIELGEIEAALAQHPGVSTAAVIVREDVPGNKRLVAYVASEPEQDLDVAVLRAFLRERLPEYMVPAAFVLLDALPVTPNGKVDRRALPAPEEGHGSDGTRVVPQTELERTVAAIWQEVLGLPSVGTNDRFFDLGGNSLSIIQVQTKLSTALGLEVELTKLFQYPTIASLAQHLSQGGTGAALEARREREAQKRALRSRRSSQRSTAESKEGRGIAIIGMAGRFPGARNVEEFWRNLCEGVEARTVLSDEELEAAGVERAVWTRPDYVRAAFLLDGVEMFDAAFFGFNPREAEVLDPQHRLFLECAWEALERAGYGAARYRDGVGVFAGSGTNAYLLNNLMGRPELLESMGRVLTLGNDKDSMATRASFLLDLRGPAVNVQTACSSSLVAVHLACQSLRTGESNLALAGGVRVGVPQRTGYVYTPDNIVSSDGHCRAFDEKSDGTVGGSGVGVVVLKRLENALEDGDFIHAVILESGINNDGASKVGFTAPSVEGQAALISEVLALADVEPGSIQYIEAHGTGTRLGDPIEIAALNQVFEGLPAKTCAIGSVKTNIGHTDAAAGIASLIKTTLTLRHQQIPPSLHFTRPNPKIDFDGGPLFVNASLSEWRAGEEPRRAGVSSFGMGGTNAHAVLEEAPRQEVAAPGRPWQLLVLSARGKRALEEATENLAVHLEKNPEVSLADLAYTLQVGRERFNCRRVLVCRSVEEARQALAARDPQRLLTQTQEVTSRPVVFLFPGQGMQYVGMGRGLYETEPVFRQHVDECCERLMPSLGFDLREILYAPEARSEEAGQKLLQTSIAQPALFVIEYALARLWMSLGLKPEAMMGHSLGEYVAACLAGVFSLEDALQLVAYRGQLMQKLPGGAMVSIHLPEKEMRGLLGPGVSLAAVNAPSLCVASGPTEAIEELEAELVRRKVEHRRLHTSHAFHSAMMEPVLEAFAERMRRVKLSAPRLPYISNLTGTWMTAAAATNPRYWVEHLRQPVRFSDGVEVLLAEPRRVFVEVGPGNGLSTLLRSAAGPSAQRVAVSSLRHPREVQEDRPFLLGAVGQLWLAGAEVEWPELHAEERRRRLPLPTYPFQRERYWVEPRPKVEQEQARAEVRRKRADIAEWFYVPDWKRLPVPAMSLRKVKPDSRWLVFLDPTGIGEWLVRKLEAEGAEVISVAMGGEFSRRGARSFELTPGQRAHYRRLGEELEREGWLPERVVHLWGVGPEPAGEVNGTTVRDQQELGFYSVLFLSQVLAKYLGEQPLQFDVVTQGTQDVTGQEPLCPGKAMVLGLCKVLPQEHPKMRCRSIDVELPERGGEERLSAQLLEELRAEVPERGVAWRGGRRWVEFFEPVRLDDPGEGHGLLRERGIYLLTGGLGRMGLVLAEYLAAAVRARLVLVGRSAFPERGEWEAWLKAHGEEDETSRKIQRLLALEKQGAEVLVARADVSRPEEVEAVLARVRERFGGLHGVLHGAANIGREVFLPSWEADLQACENQFRSKLHGMLVLREALRGQALDFVLLQSSLSSIWGGPSFAAYSAANRFLDVLAALESRAASTRWLSVNWDRWDFDGSEQGRTLAAGQLGVLPMTAAEGVEAFRRILSGGKVSNWVVSAEALEATLVVWGQREAPAALVKQALVEASSSHQRPELGTEYVAPRNEVEAALAGIWAELLGMQQVGIHDSFFQLGGHSLLGVQLCSRIHEQFQVAIPLRNLFESPTIAGLALLIVQKQGTEPLVRRLAEKRKKAPVSAGGEWPVREPSQPALLSFSQQQLWFMEQLQPGSPLNNLLGLIHMEGRLDVAALEKSFNAIIERHEALRTVFVERDGQPFQLISPSLTLELSMTESGAVPEAGREAEIRRVAKEEASQPFDLMRGPLLRVRLLKLGEQVHVLVLTVHHIIFDGWSQAVLLRELAAFYEAFLEGRTPELPPLPIQYADYAYWQRQWLQGEVLEKQLAYWKEKLSGPPPVVELPTDRPRPAVRTSHGANLIFELPRPLSEALEALSRREGATLFMTLLAALKTLLFRYTQQTDVTTGYLTAGRSRREVEGLIGFFVNTLALRVDLSGAPSFRELLGRTRQASMEAFDHQELPFEKLVDALQLERDLSRSLLFQVMFIYQPRAEAGLRLSGLSLKGLYIRAETSRFDISLVMQDTGRGTLVGAWEYNTDLFEASTITRLAGHYERLLQAIVVNPEQRITELPLMTEEEQRRVLVEWNETRKDFPFDQSVTELFEAQARRTPDAVAVSSGRGKRTYAELSREVARLAARLRERGVGTESMVALLMDRSLEFLTSVLAVFKAGGAYLPLDAEHPPQRIAQILERSGAAGVLVSRERREGLANALALLEPGVRPAEWSVEALLQQDGPVAELAAPRPEQLAYVIYTSGSTGLPKGAMLEHRGMLNHLLAKVEALGLTSADVVAQTASQCFDISVWQFLAALLVGGQVHIVEDEVAHEPRRLLERLVESGVSILETVPSLLRALLEELEGPEAGPLALSVLRWLIPTGEALPPELCRRWLARYPGIPVMNAYGPTECSDDVTHHPISAPPGPEVVRMPIGRAVANMRLYVVDQQLRPVPLGVPGELCVGGVGVGRGYLRESARTAEVFVPDPFSGEASARLYRTGDLVRHLPGGELEFLGRVDFQVKVRGFRIELGEVEAVLGQHPAVREAVVVVRAAGPGGARLVAYVAAHAGQTVQEEELQAFVSGKLPEYMMPAALVVLEKLPLTSNGKVDRRALPAPVLREAEAAFVAPTTPGEELVAGIWAQLLSVARVGRDDNFFALGGNSLLAMQAASRLRNAFKVELPMRWLFDAPTVGALAWRLDSARREVDAPQVLPLAPVPRERPLPLSFSQQRLWFQDQLAPGDSSFNVTLAARVKGPLEVASLEWSLRELCRRHESLRTTFALVQGQPVQVISPEPGLQLAVVDLSGLSEQEREAEVQRRADEDAAWPFELTKGPLLRVQLLRLSPREWVLLVALHHIVTDGWSMGLFLEELSALYEAHSRGKPSPLPELSIQYGDYAVWQRGWLSGEVLEAQLAYWRKQLAGAPAVLELPTDRPRPAFRSTRGAVAVGPVYPPALIQALRGVAQKEGVTFFMLMEAAFHTLLHRYSGQDDISVGTTVTGRTRTETEPLIGPFINTLVFRLNLAGEPTFRELLARAREMALGAYAHQDVPFEKLVEELAPERSLSHAPLFQVVFDKGGYAGGVPTKLAELELTLLSTQLTTTKFDLALVMVDQEDGMVGACQYSTDLFEEQTVLRMLGHLKTLLEGVAANVEQRLSKLPLLGEEEKRQLLVEWNATETPTRVACLHELFEEQARRTPDAVAVAFEGMQL